MKCSHFVSIAAATFALLLPQVGRADEAGDKAIAAIDAATIKADSQYLEYDAVVAEPGKRDQQAALNVWIKGEKFMSELTAPDYLKGIKTVKLSSADKADVNYNPVEGVLDALLPGSNSKPANQIPADKTEQSALLIAFIESLYPDTYADKYTATLSSDTLTLIPKPAPKQEEDKGIEIPLIGAKISVTPQKSEDPKTISKIEITLLKETHLPGEIKSYNADGKLEATETFGGYTRGDGDQKDIWMPSTIKFVYLPNNAAITLTRKTWKVNLPISDETFTKSSSSQ